MWWTSRIRAFAAAAVILLLVSACTSVRKDGEINSRMDPDRVEVQMEDEDLEKAAQSPLYDLNLKRDEIPDELSRIQNAYREPESCGEARLEREELNTILGPDPATIKVGKNGRITVKPADALGSAISSAIPYNSIIRYLSGANAYEKKFAAAYLKGNLRRSYITGWMAKAECAPLPVPRVKPVR